ncbi:MAG TPA: succinate dehydrogenase cytochrome b subunit, partial [Solirubrobacterales bacterium]|nr:succinate dehydrogenase cytochrome b subunit [Solirubrobacterales bacterium]
SSIGKKNIVAVTGAILIGYLILHMLGNLNSAFDAGANEARVDWYAGWLRDFGEPLLPHAFILWAVRVILLSALVIHITGIVQLTKRNKEARPVRYPAKRLGRSVEATAMLGTGALILAFIIFHILQFTTLSIHVTPVAEGDVYANLYYAFQKWYFVAIYLGALLFIGMHLRHGVWSFFQTLGLDSPSRNAKLRHGSTALVVILVVGFGSIPVLFFTDVLDPPRTEAVLTTLAGVPL